VRTHLAAIGCPIPLPAAFSRPTSEAEADLARTYWHWFEDPAGARVRLVESVYLPWTRVPGADVSFAHERGWLGGDSAAHMADLYRALGLAPPEEWAHAPDHLALELEFLALLIEQGTRAQQEQFLAQHLCWVPDLVARAEAAGVEGFYRAVLQFVAAFLAWDRAGGV
jgi:TorA maturation chaperone TorD